MRHDTHDRGPSPHTTLVSTKKIQICVKTAHVENCQKPNKIRWKRSVFLIAEFVQEHEINIWYLYTFKNH